MTGQFGKEHLYFLISLTQKRGLGIIFEQSKYLRWMGVGLNLYLHITKNLVNKPFHFRITHKQWEVCTKFNKNIGLRKKNLAQYLHRTYIYTGLPRQISNLLLMLRPEQNCCCILGILSNTLAYVKIFINFWKTICCWIITTDKTVAMYQFSCTLVSIWQKKLYYKTAQLCQLI